MLQKPQTAIAPTLRSPIPQTTQGSPVAIPNSSFTLTTPPISKVLANDYHIFQTFNNCGPATLSMALSYYGINVSQQELGQALRPYQNSSGDNDDKSTTLEEMAEKSKDYGFTPFHRPLGNSQIIKQLLTYDLPVIARTWTKPNEDIAHYRLIKGFDDATGEFIQDDSLQGKNLRYTYEAFDVLWKQFSYEYLVLVPADKVEIVQAILGENADYNTAWRNAVDYSLSQLAQDPNDRNARFNLSVAYYNTEEYQKSVAEFEKVQHQLPFRTLWYQIEPILAYYEVKNYAKVFEITDEILNNHNRAYSEAYIVRGKSHLGLGNSSLAREEFQKALIYNKNLREAQELLNN